MDETGLLSEFLHFFDRFCVFSMRISDTFMIENYACF